MTLEEQLDCLDGDTACWPGLIDMVNGGYHAHTWSAGAVERLGVPSLEFADGPRGCVIGPCTAFPVSMARGASFDPDLERRIGRAIGLELRAAGANYTGAVCMNLLRHPAWGRAQETYGEDPHHVGEMAAALTDGLQEHVMACMKHFALNSMENARFTVDVEVGERALHEVYLPHFKRVAEQGVASVMSAYNMVNGTYCGEHRVLLTEILREEWEWDGFVTSDFIAGLRDPVRSVTAGLNIEMPFRQQRAVALPEAVASGELERAEVEARVAETLATFLRFAHVFGERPDPSVRACAEHRALARTGAAAGMVLLSNSGVLPVAPSSVGSLAVVGRLADQPNLGDGGSSDVLQPEVVTALDGVTAAFPGAKVSHMVGNAEAALTPDELETLAAADLVVAVVGFTKEDEGEFIGSAESDGGVTSSGVLPPADHPVVGFPPDYVSPPASTSADETFAAGGDRESLRLRPDDEALVEQLAAASDRLVVALVGGSAIVAPWLDAPAATLMMWYPGMEGGHALGDVLTGHCEPGGRLPFVLPTDPDQLVDFDREAERCTYGLFHGQWHMDREGNTPARPFGFGLGYTDFDLGATSLVGSTVRAEVTNVGGRAGSTLVQVYGSVPGSTHERPVRRLVGFARIHLEPGSSGQLEIECGLHQLDVRVDGAWLSEGPVELSVGFDAASTQPVEPD